MSSSKVEGEVLQQTQKEMLWYQVKKTDSIIDDMQLTKKSSSVCSNITKVKTLLDQKAIEDLTWQRNSGAHDKSDSTV